MSKQVWAKGILFAEVYRIRCWFEAYHVCFTPYSLTPQGIAEAEIMCEIYTDLPLADEVFEMTYAELACLIARLSLLSIRLLGDVAWNR